MIQVGGIVPIVHQPSTRNAFALLPLCPNQLRENPRIAANPCLLIITMISNEMREDIKPQVGHIPRAEPLLIPSLGKNFFKVEFLVGDKRQRMLPFSQNNSQERLSIDHYVATPGLAFAIRVKLARPCKEGALYGGRVYIDSGLADHQTVYKRWSEDEASGGDVNVDTAAADHYFWIQPGVTEYIVEGFYKSTSESQRFEFAEPPRKNAPAELEDVSIGDHQMESSRGMKSRFEVADEPAGKKARVVKLEDYCVDFGALLNTIGIIRIVFCRVEEFRTRSSHSKSHEASPKQVSVDDDVAHKIKMSAKPGNVIKDRGGVMGDREAVLSNEIVYERRIVYNSFEGFSALATFRKHTHHVDFYKSMPLEALLKNTIRLRGIIAFYRDVNQARVNLINSERIQQAARLAINGSANDFVRVEDMVHSICANLSPAGSYIMCTGRAKEYNYGEVTAQRINATVAQRKQDFVAKEIGIVAFFRSEPGTFELQLHSVDPNRTPRENYQVRFAVVDLVSDHDD
jgi:hypothetical protein